MMRERFAAELGLTEEQQARIGEIREANGETARTLREAVGAKQRALEEAMLSDPNNQGAIDAASSALANARAELERHGQATHQKILQVLTPEQRERLKAMRAEHFMASAALPPGFPAIEVDGEYYWDGGLVSNTPLSVVLDASPRRDTLAFQVDLWSARGPLPDNVYDVEERRKDITFSSRTRAVTDAMARSQRYRHLLRELLEQVPARVRQGNPWCQEAQELACSRQYKVIHLIYQDMTFPNGLSLMPDERTLIVANSDPKQPIWMAFTLDEKGDVTGKRVFADVSDLADEKNPGLPDGLRITGDGTVFATAPGGVLIMNRDGKRLGLIRTGTAIANCAFGDDGRTLYMTSNHFLARVRLKIDGSR